VEAAGDCFWRRVTAVLALHRKLSKKKIQQLCREGRLQIIQPSLTNSGALGDGDVLLLVCLFVRLFVCLSPIKFVKSFATWQHLTASRGYRIDSYTFVSHKTRQRLYRRSIRRRSRAAPFRTSASLFVAADFAEFAAIPAFYRTSLRP